jgi:hypothetical protein
LAEQKYIGAKEAQEANEADFTGFSSRNKLANFAKKALGFRGTSRDRESPAHNSGEMNYERSPI